MILPGNTSGKQLGHARMHAPPCTRRGRLTPVLAKRLDLPTTPRTLPAHLLQIVEQQDTLRCDVADSHCRPQRVQDDLVGREELADPLRGRKLERRDERLSGKERVVEQEGLLRSVALGNVRIRGQRLLHRPRLLLPLVCLQPCVDCSPEENGGAYGDHVEDHDAWRLCWTLSLAKRQSEVANLETSI